MTSEINFGLSFEHFDFNFKNELLATSSVRKAIATGTQRPGAGRPHRQAVQRQGHPARQPHLADRPARVPGPLRPVRQGRRRRGRPSCSRTPATPRAPTASTPRAARSCRSGISTTAGNKLRETQGELFQAQMKEIGVEIKISNARLAEVLRRVAAQGQLRHRQLRLGRHAVRHLRQPGHLPDRRRQQLRRPTRARRSTTCSRRPTRETDEAKSAELGNQIDQLLTDDMATIPLYTQADVHRLAQHLRQHRATTPPTKGPSANANTWGAKTA